LLCHFSPYFRGIFQPKKNALTKITTVTNQEESTDAIEADEQVRAEFEVTVRLPDAARHIRIDTDKVSLFSSFQAGKMLNWC